MLSSAAVRIQIESALASRMSSAFTSSRRLERPVASVGVSSVDKLLHGGLPLGAITEIAGPECSGRTSFAMAFLSCLTQSGKVCAWVDASNSLHPESATAAGIDLSRMLWVRCGASSPTVDQPTSSNSFGLPEKYVIPALNKKSLHDGGYGLHPRQESNKLPAAISDYLLPEMTVPRCAEPQRERKRKQEMVEPVCARPNAGPREQRGAENSWPRIEQALRVTDLLLQAGGFGAIVLDYGGIAPKHAARVPLATWFRYRAAAERTQASILLLTQHPCAKSSAGLVLRMRPGKPLDEMSTVFTGLKREVVVARERFAVAPTNVIPLRKPPQSDKSAHWDSQTGWAGRR